MMKIKISSKKKEAETFQKIQKMVLIQIIIMKKKTQIITIKIKKNFFLTKTKNENFVNTFSMETVKKAINALIATSLAILLVNILIRLGNARIKNASKIFFIIKFYYYY